MCVLDQEFGAVNVGSLGSPPGIKTVFSEELRDVVATLTPRYEVEL